MIAPGQTPIPGDHSSPRSLRLLWAVLVFAVAGLVAFGVGLALTGCTSAETQTITKVAGVVEAGAEAIAISEPIMRGAHKHEQAMCLERWPTPADVDKAQACVDEVRKRWAPVMSKLDAYHARFCDLSPEQCK